MQYIILIQYITIFQFNVLRTIESSINSGGGWRKIENASAGTKSISIGYFKKGGVNDKVKAGPDFRFIHIYKNKILLILL